MHFLELPKFNLKNISAIESLDNIHREFISWIKFFKGENMSVLMKENTIFEEVEKKFFFIIILPKDKYFENKNKKTSFEF